MIKEVEIYRHVVGGYYEFIGTAISKSDNASEYAIYKNINSNDLYLRPIKNFNEKFRKVKTLKGFKAFLYKFTKFNKLDLVNKNPYI